MKKDPTEFRKRFAAWKNGELVYKDGKVVINNYTNAEFNDDGTFTDDTTRVFDDFYVTPSGVKTKYGSYTDKNWNRYKQQEEFFKTHDQLTGKIKYEPGLEQVSPEFDILTIVPFDRLTKPIVKGTARVIKNYRYPLGRTSPKITAENAANITPAQWTAAQDAAIAKGDMTEALRLRDLHFKVSAPKTEIVDINGNPQLVVHKTPNTFTVFDNNRSIGKLNWFATPNAYGENGVFATGAGKNPHTMKLYVNMRNAHKPTIDEGIEPAYINQGEDGILGIVDKDMTNYFKSSRDAGKGFMMSGGVDNPNALKSANAITYDDKGVRIPLGERDNFNISDIRYGLLPLISGGTGYGLYNTYAE